MTEPALNLIRHLAYRIYDTFCCPEQVAITVVIEATEPRAGPGTPPTFAPTRRAQQVELLSIEARRTSSTKVWCNDQPMQPTAAAASLLAPRALPIATSSGRSTRHSRASASAADDEEDADGDDRNARGAGWWAERQGPWQALVVRCAALPYTSMLNVTVVF